VAHLGAAGFPLVPSVDLAATGKVGVWVFFGLSAFLLTARLRQSLATNQRRKWVSLTYGVNRIFRVYPMYTLVVAAHILVQDFSWVSGLNHLILIEGWGELWAIPVEFQYYVAIPMVALLATWLNPRAAIIALSTAVVITFFVGFALPSSVFANELSVFPKMSPFLLGSLLALTPGSDGSSKTTRRVATVLGTVGFAVLLAAAAYRCPAGGCFPANATAATTCPSGGCFPSIVPAGLSLALSLAVTGLIYAATLPGAVSALLAMRLPVFLGKISFSLYLTHQFVARAALAAQLPMSMLTAWTVVGICVTGAYACYRLVERPGIRAGNALVKWMRGRDSGTLDGAGASRF
jgi:peptidoglycan/LPS O-acetylase OafA/YrhL